LRSRQIHRHASTHLTQEFCSIAPYIQSNPAPPWNTYVFRQQRGQPLRCPELAHWEAARTRSPCAQCAPSVHSPVSAAGLNSGMRRLQKMQTGKIRISLMQRRKEKEGPKETIRYLGSSFEAGALTATPAGSKIDNESLGKRKTNILGSLGLPSTMRLPSSRNGSTASSVVVANGFSKCFSVDSGRWIFGMWTLGVTDVCCIVIVTVVGILMHVGWFRQISPSGVPV